MPKSTWGMRFNEHPNYQRIQKRQKPDGCPEWLESHQISTWQEKGLIIWNNIDRKIEALHASETLRWHFLTGRAWTAGFKRLTSSTPKSLHGKCHAMNETSDSIGSSQQRRLVRNLNALPTINVYVVIPSWILCSSSESYKQEYCMHKGAREELRVKLMLVVLEHANHFGVTKICREFNVPCSIAHNHPRQTSPGLLRRSLESGLSIR